jgi:hypothetical protein
MKKLLLGLLYFLTVTTVSFAEDFPQEFRHFGNYGGLNTKDSSIQIADNESPDCQNVYFTTKGAIVKRNGYTKLNESDIPDTGDQITSLYQYNLNDGSTYFIASAGDTVYKMESLDGTWDDITDTDVTVTPDKKWKWITADNKLVGTNDTNPPLKWTGTGYVSALDIPTGVTAIRDIVEYRNYYIAGNIILDGNRLSSRIYYSGLKDITTWSALSFIDIAPSDGDYITSLQVLGGDLYVCKTKSIYRMRVTGDAVSPFVVSKTASHVGCVSTHGIININNTLLFPSYDGFYAFNGESSSKISTKIDPTYAGITKSQLANIVVTHYAEQNQVRWSVADGNTNDTVLLWDYSNNAWSKFTGINGAYATSYYHNGDERIYHGDYAGFVYENDKGDSDAGTAIDAYWTSKWFDFGSAGQNKRITNMVIVTDDSGDYDLNVGYSYDFGPNNERTLIVNMGSEGSLWDTAVWDESTWGGRTLLVHRLNLISQGRFFNTQFSNKEIGEDFTVYGYSILVKPMGGF